MRWTSRVFDYDDALVTLLGDAANAYVNIRTDQEQIRLLENAVRVEDNVLTFIDTQLKTGFHGVTDLDKCGAVSNLKQSQGQIAQFQIDMRTNENSLCTLLGIPVVDIEPLLNSGPKRNIPVTPAAVVVGMPADLLRRRPDVRRAERAAAAQSEQIGIAEGGVASRVQHQRHTRLASGNFLQIILATGAEQQRRAVVQLEFVELRSNFEW